jgi:hypothetical protein
MSLYASSAQTRLGTSRSSKSCTTSAKQIRSSSPEKRQSCKSLEAKAQKVGKGNTRIPEFEIKKWVDRPADCQAVQLKHLSRKPAPQQAPVETAAPADDDEF